MLLAFQSALAHNDPRTCSHYHDESFRQETGGLMNKVSASIKKLRQDKGINQNQLAEQLHVTRQAVSN